MKVENKSVEFAYLLLVLGGVLGIHRFYLGKIGTGLLFFFTFSLLGAGLIYDLITLPRQVREINSGSGKDCTKPYCEYCE